MKSFSKIVFGFLLLAVPTLVQAQICCDPDSDDGVGSPQACGGTYFDSDNVVCDPNCSDYSEPNDCTTIPLDGGLSLLAIAGGGLATAAMRRRREEELLEKEA
jgi:hypothetical protein